MRYKKWWLPPIFAVISAAFLGVSLFIYLLSTDDNSMTNHIYAFLSAGVWFFVALPGLSLLYSGKVLAGERERILLTLYNSVLILLPLLAYLFIDLDSWFVLALVFVWTEMWAFLGLVGKGDKKSDVWYVPVFIGLAIFIVNLYLGLILSGYLHILITSLAICPISIAIYARVCVRDRKRRVFYTVYASLFVLASGLGYVLYSIAKAKIVFGDSVWDTVVLALSAVGTFAFYEISALLGAGVKIKLPKKKKKTATEEKKEEEN